MDPGRRRTGRGLRRASWAGVLALTVALVPTAVAPTGPAHADVLTNSADNTRAGWYSNQPGLSPSTVGGGSFGQLYSLGVTGQVYAQPVVRGSVMVVATEHDMAYGFDPDTQRQLWSRSLGTPVAALSDCQDIAPEIGVTSTPVIDPATSTVYLVDATVPSGGAATDADFYLHALDLATGAERAGFPVAIRGAANNDPTTTFDGKYELQRPGLLLMNGVVYVAFGAHCDDKPYQGWVAGVSTTAQKLVALWTDEAAPGALSTDGPGGGIWMSGSGLMSDAPGDIVLTSSNGTPPPAGPGTVSTGALGQSEVRLRVQADGTLKAVDHFTPYDATALNSTDSDVGSGGVIALPSSFGTAAYPRLLATIGKQGVLWLTDATNLGGEGQAPDGSDAVVSRISLSSGGVRGRPAVWGGDGGYLYLASSQSGAGSGRLIAFKSALDGSGHPTLAQVGRSSDAFGFGSGSPVVTSDGTTSGSALVWTVWFPASPPPGQPLGTGAQLRAYSPVPVSGTMNLVYSAPIAVATKFSTPAVDNGRLYLGTQDGHVLAFGTPVTSPLTGSTLNFPVTTVGQTSTATETVTATSALTIQSASVTGPGFGIAGSSPPLPAAVAAGGTAALTVRFAPTASGGAAGVLTVTTSAGTATFSVSGTGQASGPQLTQSQPGLSFGGVPVNTSTNGTVLFSNTGSQPLTFDSYDMPTGPFTVSGLPAPGSSLAPGGSVVATFTFAPTTYGTFTSSLVLHTNDPAAVGFNGPNESAAAGAVALSGTGGAQSVMRLTPKDISFGSVPLGTTATQTFTVANTGGTNLNITISKTPDPTLGFTAVSSLPEGTVVAPGTSVTETVTFTPNAIGTVTSTWAITGDDGQGRQDVTFTGTGSAALPPTVSVGDVDVQRPATGSVVADVPVTLSRASTSTVTMTYTTKDGSATAAHGDYVPATGSLSFAPGQTAQTVPVTVNGAAPTPSATTFTLTVGSLAGAVSADSSGKLFLNTPFLPSSVSVSDAATPATTNGSAANLSFTLSATPAPYPGQPVTVKAVTVDGSALAGSGDYTPVSTTVTLSSSAPVQQVTVPVLHMPSAGATKTLGLALSSPTGGAVIGDTSGLGTVYTTTPPLPAISVADTWLLRPTSGTVGAVFTVSLSRPSTTSIPFSYAAVPGSGTTAADFTAVSGSTSFAAGQTSTTITVPVNGSATASGINTVVLNLSRQSGATMADPAGKAYLVSPLSHDFVSVLPAAAWVSPAVDTKVLVPVVLAAASPRTVSMTAATANGTGLAGTDYTASSATVTFPPGSTVQYLPVTVLHRTSAVSNRTFTVRLSGASGLTQLSSSAATVTLVEHTADATVPPASVAPAFTASTPPGTGTVSTPYDYTFVATGSPAPGFTVASGALPPGIGLDAVTGELSGTPSAAGTYTFTVSAANGVGTPATTAQLQVVVGG